MNKQYQVGPSLSMATANWRRQLTVALALMAIIPALTSGYFFVIYLVPTVAAPEYILIVIVLNLVLALAGFILLSNTFKSLYRLRGHLDAVARGDLAQKLSIRNGAEINSMVQSVEMIIEKLLTDNERLQFFSQQLEEQVRNKTAELQKAHMELKESEEYFRALLDNSSDIVLVVDKKGAITYASPSIDDSLGYKPEELVGRSGFDYIVPADKARAVLDFGKAILVKENLSTNTFRVRHKDGSERVLDGTGINLLDNPTVAGFVMNVHDITERKQAREALCASEAQLSNALKMAHAGHWEYDVGSDVFTFNDNFYRIFRTTDEKMGGNKMSSVDYARRFCHPDDASVVRKETQMAIESTDPNYSRQIEHRILYADGEVGHIVVRFFIVKDQQGRTVKTYGVSQDITERKRGEEKLLESERRLALMFESDPTGVMLIDRKTRIITDANRAALEMIGIPKSEVVGKVCHKFVCPAEKDQCPICDLGQTVNRSERVLLKPDGTRSPILKSVVPIMFNGVDYLLETFTDITERKLAQEALRKSEERLGNIMFSMADWVWEVDEKGVYTYSSSRGVEFLGDIVGKTPFDFMTPDEASRVAAIFSEIAKNKAPIKDLENWVIGKNGERICLLTNGVPILDEEGNLKGYRGVDKDITERKRTEEIIARNYEMLAAMNALLSLSMEDESVTGFLKRALNLVLSLKWLTFESKGCIFLADKAEKTLHIEVQQGLPDVLLTMCSTLPFGHCLCGRAAIDRTIQFTDCLDDRHEVRYEGIAQHGHYCVPILSGDRVLGVLNLYVRKEHVRDQKEEEFLRTVTNTLGGVIERKRAEKDLRNANIKIGKSMEELKLAQQKIIAQERLSALGQMASGIAHDFNNVLMPIVGYSELLLSSPSILNDQAESRDMIGAILSAGMDARQIVRRLRAVYREDDNTEYEMVDLSRIVEGAISLTMSKWKEEMRAKGITIEIKTDFQPVPEIKGNGSELREVLTNVIFNAVDALPKGGVITFRVYSKNEVSIALEVTDTGTGMDQDTLRRCREPFFTTKGGQGSGLGLAMVYGIAERHDGIVQIESKPGAGTTIRMLFPVSVETKSTKKEPEKKSESFPPLRILVIDDETRSREFIRAILKADSHCVEVAENGHDGLDMLRQGEFDLVITDRAMPKMSGNEVAKEVQKIRTGMPVIMLTGFGDIMKDGGECPSGVTRVMSKPLTQKELRHAMASVMKAGKKYNHACPK